VKRFFAVLGGEGNVAPRRVTRQAASEAEWAERVRIEAALFELEQVEPWGAVTAEALAALKERYRGRMAELTELGAAPGEGRGLAEAAAGGAGAPTEWVEVSDPVAEPASAPAAAGPGLREFLAERSILIVSYVGAFLLIVATLLFELAAETFGGRVRFAGVLALDLIFGAAAWACRRSARLRIVGTAYLAIFALIAPLVFVAAYVFLVLREQGVSVSLAVAIGALSCSALYGVLAQRLRSTGYATLSAVALVTGWCGALVAAGLGDWGGVGMAPLCVVFSVLALGFPVRGERRRLSATLPAAVAERFAHLTAAGALLWTLWTVAASSSATRAAVNGWWVLAATFLELALAYAVYVWLSGRWGPAPVVALFVSLTVLSSTAAIETDWAVASVTLVALAWVWAALSLGPPMSRSAAGRTALRALAALQAATSALVPATPDWLHLAIVSIGAGLGIFLAWASGRGAAARGPDPARWWLLYAGALWSLDWYWLVKVVLPPPERPSMLGLLTAYAPLPVLLAGIGVLAGRRLGRAWGVPVYVVAALNAAWVGMGLAAQDESVIPGWTYLVFGLVVYAVATLERFPGGAAVSTALWVAGVAWLLNVYALPAAAWPVVLAVVPWAVYGAGRAWAAVGEPARGPEGEPGRRAREYVWVRDWPVEHRVSALALAGLVAVGCFGVRRFMAAGEVGAIASLGALLSGAALLGLEGARRDSPYARAGTVVGASLGSFWVVRYLGLENAQWYVALPGAALLWSGYSLRRRERDLARALTVAGLALLLGTTAVQMTGGEGDDGVYTGTLVVESVAAVLGGVALRQRVYVLGGAAGVALAALRALLMLLTRIPLFAVFGVAALLLLALAALLAFLRGRAGSATTMRETWADWE
jgi:hypothetical protein